MAVLYFFLDAAQRINLCFKLRGVQLLGLASCIYCIQLNIDTKAVELVSGSLTTVDLIMSNSAPGQLDKFGEYQIRLHGNFA